MPGWGSSFRVNQDPHNIFSRPAILDGSFDKYVEENKNKKGTSEVDKEFLKLIDTWRNELITPVLMHSQ